MLVKAFFALMAAALLAGCSGKKSICESFAVERTPDGAIIKEIKVAKAGDGECSVLVHYSNGNEDVGLELVGTYKSYGEDVVYELKETNFVSRKKTVFPENKRGLSDSVAEFHRAGAINKPCFDYLNKVLNEEDSAYSNAWASCASPAGLAEAIRVFAFDKTISPAPSHGVCQDISTYYLQNRSFLESGDSGVNSPYDLRVYPDTDDGNCKASLKRMTYEEVHTDIGMVQGAHVVWQYDIAFTYRTYPGGVSVSNDDLTYTRKEVSREM